LLICGKHIKPLLNEDGYLISSELLKVAHGDGLRFLGELLDQQQIGGFVFQHLYSRHFCLIVTRKLTKMREDDEDFGQKCEIALK
jgi:hypothetical protein